MAKFNNASATAAIDALTDDMELGDGRSVLLNLISQLSYNGRGAEIGTWSGIFAEAILRNSTIGELVCVDPYASYEEFRDCMNFMDMEAVLKEAQDRLSPFGSRATFLRMFSADAARAFEDESLDFVYIDGNHQYEYVRDDLVNWWPKIKKGGLLIGDDYAFDTVASQRNAHEDVTIVHLTDDAGAPKYYGDYGVHLAVNRFTQFLNLDYRVYKGQFLIAK